MRLGLEMRLGSVRRGAVSSVLALALTTGMLSAVQWLTAPQGSPARADASAGGGGLFVPAAGRLLDTRNGTGGYSSPMPAGGVRAVTAAGRAGIPASGVSALALTLTAVGAATIGAVSVAPGDVATPTGTALVFNPGDSVSNTALVALHADGTLRVLADHAVHLIIDVQGYFTAGGSTAPGGFVAVDQTRVADTRSGLNVAQARVGTGSAITLQAASLAAGVPADASAVYVNIAVLNQTAIGYLRAYAADVAPRRGVDRSSCRQHPRDQPVLPLVARLVHDHHTELVDLLREGLRHLLHGALRGVVEVDGVTRRRRDHDLVHVEARSGGPEGTRVAEGDRGQGSGKPLRAEGRALQGVDGDVEVGPASVVPDDLAVEQHRRVVLLPLPDDHRSATGDVRQSATHGLGRGAVGGIRVVPTDPGTAGQRRAVGRRDRRRLQGSEVEAHRQERVALGWHIGLHIY